MLKCTILAISYLKLFYSTEYLCDAKIAGTRGKTSVQQKILAIYYGTLRTYRLLTWVPMIHVHVHVDLYLMCTVVNYLVHVWMIIFWGNLSKKDRSHKPSKCTCMCVYMVVFIVCYTWKELLPIHVLVYGRFSLSF